MYTTLDKDKKTVEAIGHSLGKTIKQLELKDNALVFSFDTHQLAVYDDGQCCCEQRYMNTDDNLSEFIGAKFTGIEYGESEEKIDSEWGDTEEIQFLIISTSTGKFTVANYNEHNGYYGGFWIVAEKLAYQ